MIQIKKSLYYYYSFYFLFCLIGFSSSSILSREYHDSDQSNSLTSSNVSIVSEKLENHKNNIFLKENQDNEKHTRWTTGLLFENIPMVILVIFGVIMNLSGILLPKLNYSFLSYTSSYYLVLFICLLLNCYNYSSVSAQINFMFGVWMLGFVVSVLTYFFESIQNVIQSTSLASVTILLWIQIQNKIDDFEQQKLYFLGYLIVILICLIVSYIFPLVMLTLISSLVGSFLVVFYGAVFMGDITPFQEMEKEEFDKALDMDQIFYRYILAGVIVFVLGFSLQIIIFNLKYKKKQKVKM